jgi:hypothetical protein
VGPASDGTGDALLSAVRRDSIERHRLAAAILPSSGIAPTRLASHSWMTLPAPRTRSAFVGHVRSIGIGGRAIAHWRNAQILFDYFIIRTRNAFRGWDVEVAMHCQEVSPSHLLFLFVPCPLCVHRMVITTVEPALLADGAASDDLEDVTHRCVQSGTMIVLRRRPHSLVTCQFLHSRQRLKARNQTAALLPIPVVEKLGS